MMGGQSGDQRSALKDCGDDERSPELYSDMVCASQVNCLKYGLQLLFFNDLTHTAESHH